MTQTMAKDAKEIGAEAAKYAADCIDEIAEKDSTPMQERRTWRRGFNAAHNFNVDSETSGESFDVAEDVYAELIADVTVDGGGMGGKEAAEKIRNRAENLLEVF